MLPGSIIALTWLPSCLAVWLSGPCWPCLAGPIDRARHTRCCCFSRARCCISGSATPRTGFYPIACRVDLASWALRGRVPKQLTRCKTCGSAIRGHLLRADRNLPGPAASRAGILRLFACTEASVAGSGTVRSKVHAHDRLASQCLFPGCTTSAKFSAKIRMADVVRHGGAWIGGWLNLARGELVARRAWPSQPSCGVWGPLLARPSPDASPQHTFPAELADR